MNERKVESNLPISVEVHIKGNTLEQRLFVQAILLPEITNALENALAPYVKAGLVM